MRQNGSAESSSPSGAVIFLKLLRFLRLYRWKMAGALVCLLASTGFSLIIPRIAGKAIDIGVGEGDHRFLLLAGLTVVGAAVLRGGFTYLQSYLGESVAARASFDVKNAIYDKIQRLSFDYHDKADTGQLMSRATVDVEAIRWFLSFGMLRSAQLGIMLVAIAVILFSTNRTLALVSFACLPVVALRALSVGSRTRAMWLRVQQGIGALGTILHENLSGIRLVKAFHREDYESERFSHGAREVYRGNIEANRVYSINTPFMAFLLVVTSGLILWRGGHEVVAGRLTQGELAQFLLYAVMLAGPVRLIGYLGGLASRAVSGGERIFEVLETEVAVKESSQPRSLPGAKGMLKLDHVSFSYDSRVPTLSDISFEVMPGKVVALVGATGSGKTTIVNLIPRFYDVSGGSITIDGIDIRELSFSALRRSVGMVQQDVFLFSASVHDNIAYGVPEATRPEVIAAARSAQLHDFIESLPRGYDTWVGERGITLSGGQRQRMAIARTLLTNPPILILDDATSSVDTGTEHLIQKALATLMHGRATLIIAQRLSSVKRADLILVIDNGRIVERGTHEELLSSGRHYQRIYDLQLRAGSALPSDRPTRAEQ